MSCTLGDLVLGMTFFYSVADLMLQYNRYQLCSRPLNMWLLVSYGAMGVFRFCQHLVCRDLNDLDDDEFFYSLTSSELLPLKIIQYGGVFPFLIGWTVLGTVWLNDIAAESPYCLPDESQPWFVLLWMTFCYLFILLQILFMVVSFLMRLRVRQLNRGIRQLETEELRTRWGRARFDSFAYGLSPFYRAGLEPDEIIRLPSELVGDNPEEWQKDLCSICLEGFNPGDSVRVLPSCQHRFHQGCADLWLLRRALCPNCKNALKSTPEEHPLSQQSTAASAAWTYWTFGHQFVSSPPFIGDEGDEPEPQ